MKRVAVPSSHRQASAVLAEEKRSGRLRRWIKRLAVACVVGGVAYLTLSLGHLWQQRVWLDSQLANLEQLEPGQVPPAIKTLAQQGNDALPELVAAMGSQQASVATAAQLEIIETLDGLDHLPERLAATRRVVFAKALAKHVSQFGPTTTRLSAYLAERMLREDLAALTPLERSEVIEACGEVMRHARRHVDVRGLGKEFDANWHETPQPIPWEVAVLLYSDKPVEAGTGSMNGEQATSHLDRMMPGGGFDPSGVVVPSLPAGMEERNSNTAAQLEAPDGLPDPSGANLVRSNKEPEDFQKPLRLRRLPKQQPSADASDPGSFSEQESARANSGLTPLETEVRKVLPSRRPMSRGTPDAPPRDETVIQLLQDLVAADQQAANRAASALSHRGLSAPQLELARRLADPDPAVRQSLVEILPRTAGLNARPWLLWLARDEHADVRLAAMNVLATSQDPQLIAEVESLARGDQDERIVRLADRLGERRRK